MIIVRVMGGLVNQMQQYALYRKLEMLGRDAGLDFSWFDREIQEKMQAPREPELNRFSGLSMKTVSSGEVRTLLGRRYEEREGLLEKVRRKVNPAFSPVFEETDMYHPAIFEWRNKYLVGYWACEAYYADILESLREELRFPESEEPRNRETALEMEACESVSIHVRRGDYLDPENAAMFGNICTEAYYESAVRYVKERYPKAVFYVFSDDSEYVREKYRDAAFRIVDWNKKDNSYYDMELMSHCRHNICANSTFSFWGARLNGHAGKIMIRPSIHKNTQACVPQRMKQLWAGWTLISPEGVCI